MQPEELTPYQIRARKAVATRQRNKANRDLIERTANLTPAQMRARKAVETRQANRAAQRSANAAATRAEKPPEPGNVIERLARIEALLLRLDARMTAAGLALATDH